VTDVWQKPKISATRILLIDSALMEFVADVADFNKY